MNDNAPTHFSDWFLRRREQLTGGGLWLDGGEPGRPDPAGFDQAKLRVLICRLSPYEDVVPSITHRLLMQTVLQVPGVYADLAYFPRAADERLMAEDHVPLWLASGCKRPPRAFDIVAVSLSVQQEALNLPAALAGSGLEPGARERLADPHHPFILLGGHAAGAAPFLHGDAGTAADSGGLVDAVCFGDGLSWIQGFIQRWMEARSRNVSRTDFLSRFAAEVEGTYVPALYRHDLQAGLTTGITRLDPSAPLPVRYRTDPMEKWLEFYDGAYIPFSREETEETLPLSVGCVYRCRFCQTGWMRGALSAASPEPLQRAARRLKAATANSDLNLLASDACSVPALEASVEALSQLFRHVSIKSLALSSLARRENPLRLFRLLEKHEFTFGIEGISPRLRAYLGKQADTETLAALVRDLAASGIRQLKLFFIATGLENEEDLSEFDRLLKKVRSIAPDTRLIASFMPLFNAPFTPLQFEEIRDIPGEWRHQLEAAVRRVRGEFRWSAPAHEVRLVNLLCRLGRAATPLLRRLSLDLKFRYYDSIPPAAWKEAQAFIQAQGLDLAPLNAAGSESAVYPWDDLESGTPREVLWAAFQKSQQPQAATAAPNPTRPTRPPPPLPPAPAAQTLSFWCRLEPADDRRPDTPLARALLRQLFSTQPEAIPLYWGRPRLLRPAGTSGLALLQADFKATHTLRSVGSDPTSRACLSGPFANAPDFSTLYWLVRFHPGETPIKTLLDSWKASDWAFQTLRHNHQRWQVVGSRFRKRTGVTAICEQSDSLALALLEPTALEQAAPTLPGAVVIDVLQKSAHKCPTCAAPRLMSLQRLEEVDWPACVDCLARTPASKLKD